MPNWCHNYMKIKGGAEELARLKQACIRIVFEGEPAQLDFGALIPMPETFMKQPNFVGVDGSASGDAPEDFRCPPRRDWAIENWGTKWNACHFDVIADKPDCYEIAFNTAWAPPVPVYQKIAKMFPELEIHLEGHESVNDFAYRGTIQNGKLELREVPIVWSIVDPETGLVVSGSPEQIDERFPGVHRVFTRAAREGEAVESCGPEATRRARWRQECDSHPEPIIDDEVPF
jgi:hypothetical protein